ncbi:4-(cytidine 5'-diphospho)-2-C-methyl-D-erythritol kinase [Xinfangfangia sp. D13-10-4-6]|uniref:4-(cytidine 5'-diphospho)-2-C-methyl-D-erythritol kinase n=1 Tax=Pseudogemmobacter hezensis TaxID=2737662 RepID=UPI0015530822|nr:4-(cytidine 5'-diphospho)-2-C-methyl-D-erythritol kinase [Pseudogemmobacter hezensis]NPD17244.1 4-(cytidine 5'-diphospho)-2-C-methyl-D-erythritol kinase [Pseudogemmobacter hezensis]
MTLLQTDAIAEFAPAKINLCLHVTGQRADGYHLLDSIVAFANIGDRLWLRPSQELALTLEGPFGPKLPSGADNLVLQAAKAVMPGVTGRFTLEKHLPPASGIGGGSSDAAAAIRAVLRLTGMPPPADLAQRAAALGADVPVCLSPGPVRMRGVGEHLEPLISFPECGVVLVNPGVEVATPAVFRALPEKNHPPLPKTLPHWPDPAALATWLGGQRNDLEAPASAIAPVIRDVLCALRAQPQTLIARMSGSGATCFALFQDEARAAAAAHALQIRQPGWWIAPGRLIG